MCLLNGKNNDNVHDWISLVEYCISRKHIPWATDNFVAKNIANTHNMTPQYLNKLLTLQKCAVDIDIVYSTWQGVCIGINT